MWNNLLDANAALALAQHDVVTCDGRCLLLCDYSPMSLGDACAALLTVRTSPCLFSPTRCHREDGGVGVGNNIATPTRSRAVATRRRMAIQ